jgi:hypothetical protein
VDKPSAFQVKDPEMIRAITENLRAPRSTARTKKRTKKPTKFRVKWARIPAAWRTRLQKTQSAHAINLAITILFEAYRAEQCGSEIVLSAQTTGLQRSNRKWAIRELERLGLIRVLRSGHRAARVSLLHY